MVRVRAPGGVAQPDLHVRAVVQHASEPVEHEGLVHAPVEGAIKGGGEVEPQPGPRREAPHHLPVLADGGFRVAPHVGTVVRVGCGDDIDQVMRPGGQGQGHAAGVGHQDLRVQPRQAAGTRQHLRRVAQLRHRGRVDERPDLDPAQPDGVGRFHEGHLVVRRDERRDGLEPVARGDLDQRGAHSTPPSRSAATRSGA